MQQVKEWVEKWFVANGKVSEDDLSEKGSQNYIENGLVDSFGFIQLVSNIEEKFQIEFKDDDFENELFFTVSGLVTIIEKHIKE